MEHNWVGIETDFLDWPHSTSIPESLDTSIGLPGADKEAQPRGTGTRGWAFSLRR